MELCLKFDEKFMNGEEKECLKNCAGKISPFMKTVKNIFKENDQKFNDFEDEHLKFEAFLKPDQFMKDSKYK